MSDLIERVARAIYEADTSDAAGPSNPAYLAMAYAALEAMSGLNIENERLRAEHEKQQAKHAAWLEGRDAAAKQAEYGDCETGLGCLNGYSHGSYRHEIGKKIAIQIRALESPYEQKPIVWPRELLPDDYKEGE